MKRGVLFHQLQPTTHSPVMSTLLPTSEATLKSFLFIRSTFLDPLLATVLYLQSLSSSSLQRSEFNKHMPSIFQTALLLRGLECGLKASIMLPRVPLHFVKLGGVRLLITCYFDFPSWKLILLFLSIVIFIFGS